jgi:type IV fimbrial biogenesis protein FimT
VSQRGFMNKPARRSAGGFTLVELLTVMTIVAVGLSLALPDMSAFARRNQISGATNTMLAMINAGRTEAVKRSLPVVVCASTDGASCSGTPTDWATGAISFVDVNADGVRQPALEELVSSSDALPPGYLAAASAAGRLRFAPNGLLAGGSLGLKIIVRSPSSPTADENRYICTSNAGRTAIVSHRNYTLDARFADCVAL